MTLLQDGRSPSRLTLLLVGLLVSLCLAGCNDARKPPAEPRSGRELLERMLRAYREATSYQDSGEVHRKFVLGDQPTDEQYNFSVAFERPNKLRMHIYSANVVSDGQRFRASIQELPDQVLDRAAPSKLQTKDVSTDQALYQTIFEGPASGSLQLALLLDDDPLSSILSGADVPELLAARTINDRACLGVQIRRADGTLTFWIDRLTYALVRAEYPIDDFTSFLKRHGTVRDVSLVADFHGATLNQAIAAEAFRFEIPSGLKTVEQFELVQRPEPLSPLLGRKLANYQFTTLDGQSVTSESLMGKVVVLDFWATWCGPCFQSLPNLNQVDGRYRGNDKVAIFAVNIESVAGPSATGKSNTVATNAQAESITNADAQAAFTKAKLNLTILRDVEQHARKTFLVEKIPSLFILGPDGTLQDHETGVNPELATDLPRRIDQLLAGGSLKEEALRRHDQQQREYEAQFRQSETQGAEMSRAVVAAPSPPVTLQLKSKWKVTSLKEPGNALVVERHPGKPTLFVNDGWGKVAEIDPAGQLMSTFSLELPKTPEEGIVLYLRTTVDGAGRRWFAGGATARQQVHLFDDQFRRTLSYPDQASAGGVADCQLSDLDGDGQPELNIGYYDVVGVQNVSLDGKRRWWVRSLSNVFRLAVMNTAGSPQRGLLCAHQLGTLVPINHQGLEGAPVQVGRRFIRAVYAEDLDGDGTSELCALASTGPGKDELIGLDKGGREQWAYPLPQGMHGHPAIESVVAANLLQSPIKQWLAAGPDGSVHLIAADGTLIDRFNYGVAISGISALAGDKPLLIISSSQGVEALEAAGPGK